MTTLRQSAKDAPHCFSCFAPNPNGDWLCLAHSNELRHGRGAYHKTPDIFGAIVCAVCHYDIDQNPRLTKDEKREKQRIAHDRTLAWWIERGLVTVAA